jgi:hypothetical protein
MILGFIIKIYLLLIKSSFQVLSNIMILNQSYY